MLVHSTMNGPAFAAALVAAVAAPGQQLPIRKGFWFASATGYPPSAGHNPCIDLPLDDAWEWNGHDFVGTDPPGILVEVRRAGPALTRQRSAYHATHVYRVKYRGDSEYNYWSIPNPQLVALNQDPLVWCADSMARLKKLRAGTKPMMERK